MACATSCRTFPFGERCKPNFGALWLNGSCTEFRGVDRLASHADPNGTAWLGETADKAAYQHPRKASRALLMKRSLSLLIGAAYHQIDRAGVNNEIDNR